MCLPPTFLSEHVGECVAHEVRGDLALALELDGRVDLIAEQLESVAHIPERRIVRLGVVTGLAVRPGVRLGAPVAAEHLTGIRDVEPEGKSALSIRNLHDGAGHADHRLLTGVGGLPFHPAVDRLGGQQRKSDDDLLDHLPDLELCQSSDHVVVLAVGLLLLEDVHQVTDAEVLGVIGHSHVRLPFRRNTRRLWRYCNESERLLAREAIIKFLQNKQSASGFRRRARLRLPGNLLTRPEFTRPDLSGADRSP
jgi:hypothetical protein